MPANPPSSAHSGDIFQQGLLIFQRLLLSPKMGEFSSGPMWGSPERPLETYRVKIKPGHLSLGSSVPRPPASGASPQGKTGELVGNHGGLCQPPLLGSFCISGTVWGAFHAFSHLIFPKNTAREVPSVTHLIS